MKEYPMTFKVSLNEEARADGEAVEVTTIILLDDTEVEACILRGLKNRIIAWQANIKANWEKFEADGFPESLNFSDLPYASSRVRTRSMTQEEMADFINNMEPEDKAAYLKEHFGV